MPKIDRTDISQFLAGKVPDKCVAEFLFGNHLLPFRDGGIIAALGGSVLSALADGVTAVQIVTARPNKRQLNKLVEAALLAHENYDPKLKAIVNPKVTPENLRAIFIGQMRDAIGVADSYTTHVLPRETDRVSQRSSPAEKVLFHRTKAGASPRPQALALAALWKVGAQASRDTTARPLAKLHQHELVSELLAGRHLPITPATNYFKVYTHALEAVGAELPSIAQTAGYAIPTQVAAAVVSDMFTIPLGCRWTDVPGV
jgi:hypothetical protein